METYEDIGIFQDGVSADESTIVGVNPMTTSFLCFLFRDNVLFIYEYCQTLLLVYSFILIFCDMSKLIMVVKLIVKQPVTPKTL